MRGISDQIKETLEKNPDAKFTGFEIGRMAKYYKNRNVSNPATNTEAKNKINYQNYTEQDFETNAKALVSMKSVKDLTGNEFSNKEVPLKERIRSFFASLGNKVKTKEFGEVALNNSSLHDDFGHGLTFNKVVSFDAIPEVLNSGVVIDSQTRGNGNYERIIVAAPITIANEPCYMGVMLQRDFQSQRLYLHDVVTLKQIEALNLSETTPVTTEVSEKSNSLYMTSILQKAVLVNTHSMQNTRTNNNATLGDVEDSTNIHEKNIVEAPLTRANPKDSPRSTNASTIINDTTVTEESQEIKYEMPTVSRDGIDIRSENDPEIQERLANAQDDIERTGILSGASDTTIRIARRLSKVFKVNILFEVSPVRIVGDEKYFENGRYSPEEKTIYINMGSDKSPLVQVISHEFIHSIEGTGLYNRLERYARKFYEKKKGQGGFDTEATKILDEYHEAGKTKYTLAKAQAEVVANYVSTELLSNEENIQRFVAEEHSLAEILRGIIDTVLSVVGNTKAKAEAQTRVKLRRASKLLNEALQSRNTRASTENTIRNKYQELQRQLNDSEITEENFDTLLEQLDEEASAMGIDLQEIISSFSKSDNNSYSIVALENGNVYVKASRNVIQGTTKAEQRKNITDFFNDLLNEKTSLDIHTIEGDVLTITNDTATKARDDYKTVKGQPTKLSDEEFAVKMRAEAHIDEIAETSVKNQKNRKDSKNHPFAKDGFTYRRAYFEDFDGQYYEVTLSVGHNGTVATVYNIGKIQESVSPSAKIIAVVGSKPLSKTLSNTIIRNSDEKSTGNLSLSSNNPDVAPEGTLKTTEKNIPDSDSFSITKQATNKHQYTDEEYNAYGWAAENNLLNAGQNADYRTKFAQAKTGQAKFNKTKNGELIIPVSDIYDPDFEGVNNVLVFAKGTIDNPVITSIIEIDEYDETNLDILRRNIYALERRGIHPKVGELFRRYSKTDFAFQHERKLLESSKYSGGISNGRRSDTEAYSAEGAGSNKLKNSNGTDSFSITAEKTAEKIVEKKKDNAPIANQLPRDTFGKLKVTEKALRKAIGDVYQIRYARVDVSNTSTSKSEVLVLFTGRIINKLLLTFYLKKCKIK